MANENPSSVTGLNKTAAFNVYANLCEVHGYSRVVARKDDELDYIYFEANRYGSEKDPRLEYILPIDEKDSKFDLTLIEKLVAKLNKSDQEAAVSKVKLGIVSTDAMAIYYDLSIGLDSPHSDDQLLKTN